MYALQFFSVKKVAYFQLNTEESALLDSQWQTAIINLIIKCHAFLYSFKCLSQPIQPKGFWDSLLVLQVSTELILQRTLQPGRGNSGFFQHSTFLIFWGGSFLYFKLWCFDFKHKHVGRTVGYKFFCVKRTYIYTPYPGSCLGLQVCPNGKLAVLLRL